MKDGRIYKGVIFDLDGLLIDNERLSLQCWREAVSECGFELSKHDSEKLLGLKPSDISEQFKEMFGEGLDTERIIKRRFELFDEFVHEHGLPVKEGVEQIIEFVEEKGIKKAIATSSERNFGLKNLVRTGLDKHFDTVVFAEEVKNNKPAPDIYLNTAERLNLKPDDCMAIEDSESGIKAASSAGMLTLMVPDIKEPSQKAGKKAYRIFNSLKDVVTFLEEHL